MINESQLTDLRFQVKSRLSDKRFRHTKGVESMAEFLGMVLLPDKIEELRAAALLHDITKEIPESEQLSMIESYGITLTDTEKKMNALFHSYSAPFLIKRDFPDFATEDVLDAVITHTAGAPDMTTFQKIIFIADYAEESRTFPSCISVRQYLYEGLKHGEEEPEITLDRAVLMALDSTIMSLVGRESLIADQTFLTRNAILARLSH